MSNRSYPPLQISVGTESITVVPINFQPSDAEREKLQLIAKEAFEPIPASAPGWKEHRGNYTRLFGQNDFLTLSVNMGEARAFLNASSEEIQASWENLANQS